MKIRLLAKATALVLLTLGFYSSSIAQLTIDTSLTPDQMTSNLVGTGVSISNTVITGAPGSYGYYYSVGTEIGTSDGILLTTGQVSNAIGPNDETGFPQLDSLNNCLDCDDYDNDYPGNALLTAANGGLTTWDAVTYEFDIVPQGDSLSFEYHFASEEYLEWVGSSFNDVFGFFITGPGLAQVNIATIPGTTTPVAINSVNHIDNTAFFYNNTNPSGDGVQYDGFTVNTVAAIGGLSPCATYHIEMIIADGSDHLWDSGVFISKIQSNPVTIQTSTAEGLPYMVEGCNDGFVNFINPFPALGDLDIEFTLGGVAELGTDYTTTPDLAPFYNAGTDSYFMTIPSGDTTVGFSIQPLVDNIEGEELINIQMLYQLCDSTFINNTVDFAIMDELPTTVVAPGGSLCPNECLQLTGTAETQGTATYSWSPTTNMSDTLSLTPTVCPSETTTYTLTNTAGSCSHSEAVTVVVAPLEATFNVTDVTCSQPNIGAIDITMTTGVAPYDFTWTGPGNFSSTDEDISNLIAGEYCVTVVDALGCTTVLCTDVVVTNQININLTTSDFGCSNEISCNGLADGTISLDITGGNPGYTTVWTLDNVFYSNDEDLTNLGPGAYEVTVTDTDGCEEVTSVSIDEPDPVSIVVTGVVDVLCSGESNGQIIVDASGGCTPYNYSWQHDPNLNSSVINVPTGTYTAIATDANGCASVDSASVFVADPTDPISVVVNVNLYPNGYGVTCPNASDGSVDITVTGGTPGVFPAPAYTYNWEHIASGVILTDEDPTGMVCGDWEMTVTDDNGCSFVEIVNVPCVPNIVADYTTVPNSCGGDGAGEIHISSFSGGNGGPYSIVSWTGPSCPCAGMDLVGLNNGAYTVTVQDGDACQQDITITINMDANITVTPSITNETCFGYADGAIDIDVDLPYDSLIWSGPDAFSSTDEDISGLIGGNYSVTTYAGSCENTFIYNVATAPEITINLNATPPTCFGNNNGSITAVLGGGVGTLTPTWTADTACFFPASGSNDLTINDLFDCTYFISVEDDNGCIATDSVSIEAPQVMDIQVSVSLYNGGYNISCNGENDGSISVAVNGGTPDCSTYAPECYLYEWVGPVALDPISQQNDLPGGIYSVTVTDSLGCTATTIIPMNEPDPISISTTTGPMSCNDTIAPWVTYTLSGGSGTYLTPNWLNDISPNVATDTVLVNLPLGTYCAEVTDNNSCPADTVCFDVVAPEQLAIVVDSMQNISCFGLNDGYISVSGSGGIEPYTYTWTGDTTSTGLIQNLLAGSYTVEVVDTFGCSNTATYAISEPEELTVDLLVPTVIDNPPFLIPCKGDSVVILSQVNGGTEDYSYLWEDCDNNFIDSLGGATSQGVGCYQLTVTDFNGCTAQDTITLTEPDSALVVSAVPELYPNGFNLSCFNSSDGNICADVSGGVSDYSYFWTSGNDTISFEPCIDSLDAGNYDLVVFDSNGCSELIMNTLTAPPPIVLNEDNQDVSCYGLCDGSISINPTGGSGILSVNWDVVVADSLNLVDLCASEYSVTVTDATGCELENTITINQPDSLWLAAPSINNINCFGDGDGSIFSDPQGGNGGYIYEWTPGNQDTQGITNLDGGEYCLTVTDSEGCEASDCYEVTEPDIIDGNVETVDATCGIANGTATPNPSGGVPPYTYNWNGLDPNALAPGNYVVTIQDAVNCSMDVSFTIGGPDPLEINSEITDLTCYNSQEGGIDITLVSTGISIDAYEWTNSNGDVVGNAIDIDNLNGGVYTLTIQWDTDCYVPFEFTVEEPAPITINGYSPEDEYGFNISINGDDSGEIITDVQGGVPGYSYTWIDGAVDIPSGTTNPMNLIAGEYPLQVIDANGCVADTTFLITEAPDLALPSGLTPNNDGENDFFVILGIAKYAKNTFKVFNRWGNLVYDKDNYNNEWNGQNNNGEDLPNSTYYVIFQSGDKEVNTYVDLRR